MDGLPTAKQVQEFLQLNNFPISLSEAKEALEKFQWDQSPKAIRRRQAAATANTPSTPQNSSTNVDNKFQSLRESFRPLVSRANNKQEMIQFLAEMCKKLENHMQGCYDDMEAAKTEEPLSMNYEENDILYERNEEKKRRNRQRRRESIQIQNEIEAHKFYLRNLHTLQDGLRTNIIEFDDCKGLEDRIRHYVLVDCHDEIYCKGRIVFDSASEKVRQLLGLGKIGYPIQSGGPAER